MKLTDFLQDVGRPVAYYPSLRKITGSTNATILLCQFIYWRGKESDPNGWLYKTAEDIEQETGLSYGEQKTARRDLIAAGLLEEHYARLDHQMRFRLLLEAINEKWGTIETSIPESGKPQFGNDANPLSLNESENTAENTTDSFFTAEENAQNEAKMKAILEAERQAQEAQDAGKAWRGRELLAPEHLVYGDWWHAKTGLHMYGAKSKAKLDTGWANAFKELYENDVTISALDEAYKSNEWRTVSNPAQIVKDAKAIQAAPKAEENTTRPEGVSSGYYA